MSFSKLKAILRKLGKRTIPRLCRSIGAFVPTLSAREAPNYFRVPDRGSGNPTPLGGWDSCAPKVE